MLEDQESGEMMEVNTSSGHVRNQFAKQVADQQADLENTLLRTGIDHISLETNEDYLPALRQFFERRERRMMRP